MLHAAQHISISYINRSKAHGSRSSVLLNRFTIHRSWILHVTLLPTSFSLSIYQARSIHKQNYKVIKFSGDILAIMECIRAME